MESPLLTSHALDAGTTWSGRIADFRELAKPRIAAMALITVSAGFLMSAPQGEILIPLCHALFGIAMIAGASGALNQFWERETDGKMIRTANRPLPAGRVTPSEALWFGLLLGMAGTAYLAWFVNGPTAVLSASTLLLYVLAYTPLKRLSSWCTIVGAIPGAMPPVLGWAAAGGGPLVVPITLFGILYIWQFPHLLAIAWIYRHQYAAAGLHMLPGPIPRRGTTGNLAVLSGLPILPVSLLPALYGDASWAYVIFASIFGCLYIYYALQFRRDECHRTAKRLLWASLVYLPLVLAALAIDHSIMAR